MVPLHGCIHQERNEMACHISKWQCIQQDFINPLYFLYLVLTDCFKDLRVTAKSFTTQISCKPPYIFFSSCSHKTLLTRGIYSEPASPGLYPPHITLLYPMITVPTCRHLNAKAGVRCTAWGKADWGVYLEISIFLKRRQVNLLPGARAQYTHLP